MPMGEALSGAVGAMANRIHAMMDEKRFARDGRYVVVRYEVSATQLNVG